MAPPKGSSGPKPMTAGLAPPSRAPVQQAVSQVNIAQLSQSLQNAFDQFLQVEQNAKVRQETEVKF